MTTPGDQPVAPGAVQDGPPGAQTPPGAVTPAFRTISIRHTRISGLWTGVILAAVVLIFLLIFILENGQDANVSYFGAHGHVPLGVALLLAAVAGALLVIIPGTGRILQLRRTARRHRRLDARTAGSAGTPAQSGQVPQPALPGDRDLPG